MYKQSLRATIKAAIGILLLTGGGIAMAAPLNVPPIGQGSPASSSGMNQLFDTVEGSVNDNDSRITSIENRLVPIEDAINGQTVPVNCTNDAGALKNLTLTPNTTYVLTGICDGQIAIGGPGLGTIVVKGDASGTKDDGITLQAGETDGNTIFAAIYGQNGVLLFLENLVINSSAYNSEVGLFIGSVGAYNGAQVYLENVDVIGGDYGIGAYNTGAAYMIEGVRVLDWSLNGVRAERAGVIRGFDTVEITGGTNQDWNGSEAVYALRGGVIVIDNDGDGATMHTIEPASGPNISIENDNVAAVSAWQNGTIRVDDADITGVVWSGDGSAVELRNVVQRDGYVNPYRNSVLRFRDSNIGNGSAFDMTFYAGDFSVLRLDSTTVGNVSGTETASTYRYGVIDLRGTTNFGGRDINCADGREISIRASVTGVGTVSCLPPP